MWENKSVHLTLMTCVCLHTLVLFARPIQLVLLVLSSAGCLILGEDPFAPSSSPIRFGGAESAEVLTSRSVRLYFSAASGAEQFRVYAGPTAEQIDFESPLSESLRGSDATTARASGLTPSGPVALLVRAVAADGTEDDNTATVSVTTTQAGAPRSFESDILPILTVRCAFGTGCHAGATPGGGFSLCDTATDCDPSQAHASLLAGSAQVERPRVEPGDSDTSYIIDKVLAAPGIVQCPMPRPSGSVKDCRTEYPALEAADLATLIDWIDEGAQLN